MARVILDAYSSFRTEAFTATVVEMGIKEFGDDAIPKAYIEFDDGGAPLTYPIEAKGKCLIENIDPGRAKIKNFGAGAFVEQAKKLGYQTFIDVDPESYEFGTIPDIVGLPTTWDVKKGGDRIDADGNKKEGYTNFILVAVGGKKTTPQQPQSKTPEKPSQSQPEQKVDGLDDKTLTAWKSTLNQILVDPMDAGSIQRTINELSKGLPAGDPMKATYTAMSKCRSAALKSLKDAKFIQMNADLKYELV